MAALKSSPNSSGDRSVPSLRRRKRERRRNDGVSLLQLRDSDVWPSRRLLLRYPPVCPLTLLFYLFLYLFGSYALINHIQFSSSSFPNQTLTQLDDLIVQIGVRYTWDLCQSSSCLSGNSFSEGSLVFIVNNKGAIRTKSRSSHFHLVPMGQSFLTLPAMAANCFSLLNLCSAARLSGHFSEGIRQWKLRSISGTWVFDFSLNVYFLIEIYTFQ